jgi:hypothetical protein
MASARADVRSNDGSAGTAVSAVENSYASGRAASLNGQVLPGTTGSGTAVNVNDRLLAERASAAGQAGPVTYVARLNPFGHFANTMFFLQGAANACDLNSDGTVNQSDVDLAIGMSLAPSTCTANILGLGVCNVMVVQKVINASKGDGCHTVSLSWVASTSQNVAGYNVYKGTTSGGPFTTKLNSSLVTGTSFVDPAVQAAQTYYYVVRAVDASGNSSVDSNVAQAVVPSP